MHKAPASMIIRRIGIVILQNSQSAERNEAAIERIVLDALGTAPRAGE